MSEPTPLQEIERWIEELQVWCLPDSPLGKALAALKIAVRTLETIRTSYRSEDALVEEFDILIASALQSGAEKTE